MYIIKGHENNSSTTENSNPWPGEFMAIIKWPLKFWKSNGY